jgi:hypothetical protein
LLAAGDPYLIIYFNWGAKSSKAVNLLVHCAADVDANKSDPSMPFHEQDNASQLGIGVYGCGLAVFPFLKAFKISENALRMLLTASPDPYQLIINSKRCVGKDLERQLPTYQTDAVRSIMRDVMAYGPVPEAVDSAEDNLDGGNPMPMEVDNGDEMDD